MGSSQTKRTKYHSPSLRRHYSNPIIKPEDQNYSFPRQSSLQGMNRTDDVKKIGELEGGEFRDAMIASTDIYKEKMSRLKRKNKLKKKLDKNEEYEIEQDIKNKLGNEKQKVSQKLINKEEKEIEDDFKQKMLSGDTRGRTSRVIAHNRQRKESKDHMQLQEASRKRNTNNIEQDTPDYRTNEYAKVNPYQGIIPSMHHRKARYRVAADPVYSNNNVFTQMPHPHTTGHLSNNERILSNRSAKIFAMKNNAAYSFMHEEPKEYLNGMSFINAERYCHPLTQIDKSGELYNSNRQSRDNMNDRIYVHNTSHNHPAYNPKIFSKPSDYEKYQDISKQIHQRLYQPNLTEEQKISELNLIVPSCVAQDRNMLSSSKDPSISRTHSADKLKEENRTKKDVKRRINQPVAHDTSHCANPPQNENSKTSPVEYNYKHFNNDFASPTNYKAVYSERKSFTLERDKLDNAYKKHDLSKRLSLNDNTSTDIDNAAQKYALLTKNDEECSNTANDNIHNYKKKSERDVVNHRLKTDVKQDLQKLAKADSLRSKNSPTKTPDRSSRDIKDVIDHYADRKEPSVKLEVVSCIKKDVSKLKNKTNKSSLNNLSTDKSNSQDISNTSDTLKDELVQSSGKSNEEQLNKLPTTSSSSSLSSTNLDTSCIEHASLIYNSRSSPTKKINIFDSFSHSFPRRKKNLSFTDSVSSLPRQSENIHTKKNTEDIFDALWKRVSVLETYSEMLQHLLEGITNETKTVGRLAVSGDALWMSQEETKATALKKYLELQQKAHSIPKWLLAGSIKWCLGTLIHLTSSQGPTSACLFAAVEGDSMKIAPLTIQGQHILMHALMEQSSVKPTDVYLQFDSIKMLMNDNYPVVFLDIGWNGTSKGIIYIKVDIGTVLGQQFVIMCTSEHNKSYKSSHFHYKSSSDSPCVYIMGGDYDKGDGTGGVSVIKDIDVYCNTSDPKDLEDYFKNVYQLKIVDEIPKYPNKQRSNSIPNLSASSKETSSFVNTSLDSSKLAQRRSVSLKEKRRDKTDLNRHVINKMINGSINVSDKSENNSLSFDETNDSSSLTSYTSMSSSSDLGIVRRSRRTSSCYSNSKYKKTSTKKQHITKGLVCGRFRNDTDTIFKIYLRDENTLTDDAAFGNIVSGVDLLDKMHDHDDIKQITILDCGVVISLKDD